MEVEASPAQGEMIIHVTRKDTGLVETYRFIQGDEPESILEQPKQQGE